MSVFKSESTNKKPTFIDVTELVCKLAWSKCDQEIVPSEAYLFAL